MTEPSLPFAAHPPDHEARTRAIDTKDSFIVQAPAGSGKTMLLTERFLRLLETVDEPEQVLAITFTKAAVAEMRARALEALTAARDAKIAQRDDERRLIEAANLALEHANARGWHLLEDPQQLNISTIDSLALQIAQRTPLLSRLGPGFAPTEDASAYYRRAASRTLRSIEHRNSADPALRATAEAALTLLRHRDNNLAHCTELIAVMLESRDQWGRYFPLDSAELDDNTLDRDLRPRLVRDLELLTENHLRFTHQAMTASGIDTQRLLELACFAAETGHGDIADCLGLVELPEPAHPHLPKWRGLARLLLTKDGDPRRTLTYKEGFPRGAAHKQALLEIIGNLGDDERLSLHQLRELPPPKFSDDEWQVAKALFRLLHSAVVQLKLIFAEAGTVDFTEVSVAARTALQSEISGLQAAPSDLALMLSGRYRHLLVDEFQDTSVTQFEILTLLLAGWEQGDGRSVFLVGDPMQSIYLFRQAQMRLFATAARLGLAEIPLDALKLKVNFRSQPALIAEHNRIFEAVFSGESTLEFAPSEAFGGLHHQPAVQWHFFRKPAAGATADERESPRREEAVRVRELIEQSLKNPAHRIAVLVRAKWHAGLITRELRDASIPYRAIDMESLDERQEVLDALALTRALLHPADRAAWLSVFRAPWCGLALASLETLCESSKPDRYARPSLLELLPENLPKLPPDERVRAERVHSLLREAWQNRDQLRLPQLIWRVWTQLGGPACCDAEQYENVSAFFALLEKMDAEGQPWNSQTLTRGLKRLFAQPNPDASARVELLTIHKAKGLGFDIVIVPHLDRRGGRENLQAIDWLEQPRSSAQDDGTHALYIAPIQATGADKSSLNAWVRRKRKDQINAELKRLFYVAATRARHQLHLLASIEVRDDDAQTLGEPAVGSLLHVAWETVDTDTMRQQIIQPGVEDTIAAAGTVVSIRDGGSGPDKGAHQIHRLPDPWYSTPLPDGWLRAETPSPPLPIKAEAVAAKATLDARARGIVLHSLLEQVAHRLARGESFEQLIAWANNSESLIRKLLTAEGLPQQTAKSAAPNVHKLLQKALLSPIARWVLAPRPGALIEFPITHWKEGIAYSLRVDRIFSGGEEVGSNGDTHIWIVDYKSVDVGGRDGDSFLSGQVAFYAEALARYARAWRDLGLDPRPIRCALYFPAQDKLKIVS